MTLHRTPVAMVDLGAISDAVQIITGILGLAAAVGQEAIRDALRKRRDRRARNASDTGAPAASGEAVADDEPRHGDEQDPAA